MTSIALSQERLNAIAEEIAARLLDQHYFEQGIITGEQLKSFTPNSQINKFLLFQVYQVWSMQVSRLRHPYFNFEHPHVEQTLTHLQNLLSQHIAIRAEDFRPLLIQAVFNTLRLTLQPAEALQDFFFTGSDKLPLATFAKYVPFFSDFDFAVGSILVFCQKNGIETIDRDIFRAKFDKVASLYGQQQEGGLAGYRSALLASLTDAHTLESLAQEAEQEAIARAEAERLSQLSMQQEAEQQRRADEEAKRFEAQQREAEARREADERARNEAEAQRANQSFFDTLEAPVQTVFDLADEAGVVSPLEATRNTAPEETAPEFFTEPVNTDMSPLSPAVSLTWDSSIQVVDDDSDQWSIVPDEETTANMPENQPESQTRALDAAPVVQTRSLFGALDGLQHAPVEAASETLTFADEPGTQPNPMEAADHQPVNPLEMTAPDPLGGGLPASQDEPLVTEEPAEPLADDVAGEPQLVPPVAEPAHTDRPMTLAERLRLQSQGMHTAATPGTPPPPATPAETQVRLDAIPIHKQYQFVKKVFAGNNVRFRIIVDKINAATSKEEIEDTLQKFVFSIPEVDQTDSVVEEFMMLMRSRFS